MRQDHGLRQVGRVTSGWCRSLGLVAMIASVALGSVAVSAAPVAEDEKVPIDLRRTTLVVRNMERSLALYRDALGMQVIYDRHLRTPKEAASDEEAERVSHLVLLRANDNFIGVLGLLEYKKPRKPALHQGNEPFSPGSAVLVFNSHDAKAAFAKAKDVLGVAAISEPKLSTYPSPDGSERLEVIASVIKDPDGFVVELNQLMSDVPR